MTYPFDQISALGKANGQLALALVQIARDSGEGYVQIGSKAATAVFDQFKGMKPGSLPGLNSESTTSLFSEVEKNREASAAKIKTAFDEWQGCCKDVLSQAAGGPQQFTDSVQNWFQPLIKSLAIGPESAVKEPVPTPRAAAKSVETA